MTLISTDMTFGGILLRIIVVIAILGIIYIYKACKDAPVYKDEEMKMSIPLMFVWKDYAILSIAPAITLLILFVLVFMLTKRGPFPGTGHYIDRKPIKRGHGNN